MPPPGYGSRESVGYPPSQCDSDSLVRVGGDDSLCYRLCGCLPCFRNKYEGITSANDPFASRYFMQQAGDGSSMCSREGSISSACPAANTNPAFQREFQQDDPELPPSESLGRIQFSIGYDFQQSTLTLKVIRASNLVAKDLGGTSDPYVKVILLPDKKSKLCTKRKRKNLNPKWNEVFAFEGYPYNKLQNSSLFLQVLDYDRFSKDDPIGEICIPLSELDLGSGQTLWKNLQPSQRTGNLGQLYVSLCYDSVSSEIKVTIVKAMHLKAKDLNGLSDPYVKIWLMQDGKRVEKKKTTTRTRNLNPIYNETLTFIVALDRIRTTSLLISVMDFDKMGRNEAIGQIILGSKSGPLEVKHWTEMFSKPKQDVGQWHVLKDFS